MTQHRESPEEFEVRLEALRAEYRRRNAMSAQVFCTGCQTVRDSRQACPRCTAFAAGLPCPPFRASAP